MIPFTCPKCNGPNIRMKEATGDCSCQCGHTWNANANAEEPPAKAPTGRKARPITYEPGTPIPGTHLTPIDYSTSPPSYQCECGATVALSRSLVEGRFRRSCGQCGFSRPPKKCVFCKTPGQTGTEFLAQRICVDCTVTLKERL